MPYLGDYIGHLLSEMSIARMHADYETRRIAEIYMNDPILKNFPIPRFRLPDLTLDVPVIVEKMEEPKDPHLPRGIIYQLPGKEKLQKILETQLSKSKLEIKEDQKKKILNNILDSVSKMQLSPQLLMSGSVITDRLASAMEDGIKKVFPEQNKNILPQRKAFLQNFRESIKEELSQLVQLPPRLHVRVTSNEIKEMKSTEMLARLKLTIREEACEWAISQEEGKTKEQLILE